jgi:DNA-binding NarL/FixJ family response regulator
VWQAAAVPLRTIMLSLHQEPHVVRSALDAGARAYVLKDRAAEELIEAIAVVMAGRRFVSAPVAAALATGDELEKLTSMERTVVRLLSDNKTSAEIAATLGIALRTVQNHRAHAASKLGLSGPHRLLQFALERRDQLQRTP